MKHEPKGSKKPNYKLYCWPHESGDADFHRVLVTYNEKLGKTLFITIDRSDVVYEPLEGYKPDPTNRVTFCDGWDETAAEHRRKRVAEKWDAIDKQSIPVDNGNQLKVDDKVDNKEIDPWPVLPNKSEQERVDDKSEVVHLLYSLNFDTALDNHQGSDLKPFSYHEIEPEREIFKKDK